MLRTIFQKLLASYLVIILLALTTLGFTLDRFLYNFFIQNQRNEFIRDGLEISELMATSSYMRNPSQLLNILSTIDRFSRGQIWIVDRTGLVLGSTMGDEGFRLNPDEVRQVLSGRIVDKVGKIPRLEEPVLSVAVPIISNEKVIGAVLLFSPLAEITTSVRQVRLLIWRAAVIAIAVAALLALTISRSLSSPIRKIRKAALSMAKGNFDERVELSGEGELEELAKTFNYLAGQLELSLKTLYKEKEQTESILANMNEAVLTIDQDGQILSANPAARNIFKLPGLNVNYRRHLKSPELISLLAETLEHQRSATGEVKLGEDRYYLVQLTPIRSYEEEVLLVVLQDISAQWQLEAMRKQFVANVSHELRTPLTSIQGFVEAILDGVITDTEGTRHYLKIVLAETQRLSRLVTDLLDLSRLEAGELPLKLEPLAFNPLLEEMANTVEPQLRAEGIELELLLDQELPQVLGDRDRLVEVVLNLFHNSLRFTPTGGTITIATARVGSLVQVTVADTGPGIKEEDLEHLFERFYKSDRSRTRGNGGTGLGLAIVKQIVEAHQGEVWAESLAGSGAAFHFTLPAISSIS